jgi:hypothetical protein
VTAGAYQRAIQRQLGVLLVGLSGIAIGVVSAEAQPAAVASAAPEAFPTFRIHAHVAHDPDAVADRAWLDAQVAEANRIFASAGVSFELARVEPLDAAHARLETRADRHALGAEMDAGVINWFVVRSLRDVDEPDRHRLGVHWRPAGHPGKHLVIVAAHAMQSVLAHELGHFFGNPHSETPGNLMSYDRGDAPPFFDAAQIRRIRRFARRFVRTRELAA